MALRLPLAAFVHSPMTPVGYLMKILAYIYFKT
jgi:hypothetical protein